MSYYYVYVLQSRKDTKLYTGYTSNLKKRLDEHNSGLSFSTKSRVPFSLIYFEGCVCRKDAIKRERYLKTTYGKRYIKNRLQDYFQKDIT